MKILAIDDNPDNLTVLKAVLRDRLPDAGLVTALNGQKGLELAASEDPDVILLDIVMPGVDGYEVCRKLKADLLLQTIPVLFLTAHTDRDSRIKAVEAGADGFLSKPFDELELTVQIIAMSKLKAANRLQRLEKEELTALVAERTRELERELSEHKQDAEINAFLASVRGNEINGSFFHALAGFLAENLGMDFVCIDRLEGDGLMARTLAIWSDGHFQDNVTYALKDTPCGEVVGQEVCCFPSGVSRLFSRDQVLQDLRAESYVGTTLFDHNGQAIGLIAVIGRGPLANRLKAETMMKRVSQFAAIELGRLNAEAVLLEATLLLQQTSRMAKIGGWQLDLQSNNVAWTQETYRIHEVAEDYQPKLSDGLSFYPQESRPAIEEAVRRAIEKGARFDLEVPFITAKGNQLWVKSSGEPQYEEGRCVRISGTFQDITERKKSEESLQILQTAVEQSANMVAITDIRGNIEYVNPAFEKNTGYTAAEAIGKTHRILKSGEHDAEFYRRLWTTIMSGKNWQGEFHNKRKDGSLYWESATISPVQNDKGETVRYLAIKEDITERKAMELALASTRDRLLLATKAGGVGIWDWDIVNNSLLWDDQMYLQYGITRDQFGGAYEAWAAGVHPEDKMRGDAEIQMAFRGEKEFDTEFRVLWPDGTIRNIRALALVQRDASGKPLRMIGTNWDITEFARTEKELKMALERAEESAAAKSEFLSIMSHELRTPLNGVLGFAELLADTPLAEEQRSCVETISSSGEHLLAIVNDILDFSSIEKGAMAIQVEPFAFAGLMKSSEQAVRKSAMDKGLAFRSVIDPGVPEQIPGDERRIRQILINLLGNAVKFTSTGSATLRVASIKKEGKQFLDFSVEDTGIGMSPETMRLLFNPFTQADMKMNRSFGGTGLGLAISKRLAEAMGGTLTVASTLGVGSVFTFLLPLEIPLPSSAPSASAPCDPASTPASGTLVLVVEDDQNSSELAGVMLQSLGFRAEFAAEGAEAVKAFAPGKYFAILMDMAMPVLDGLEATKIIREIEKSASRVPIIALTANVMSGDRERCLAAGMDDFLTKPFKRADLAAKLACISRP